MTRTKIFDTPCYSLMCWGNGTAYALTNKPTNESVYVQGDDATTFGAELEGLQINRPDLDVQDMLADLWSTYEPVAEREWGKARRLT